MVHAQLAAATHLTPGGAHIWLGSGAESDTAVFANAFAQPRTRHVFLYNLTADRAETTDLWASRRDVAKAMLGRFMKWQVWQPACLS